MIAIEVEHVSKRFRRQTVQPATTLKGSVVDALRGRWRRHEVPTFEVLHDVSFTVRRGQVVGIAGRNGSGKSTLLRVLAGIYQPDQGRVTCHGRLGAILELGAGFHPEFNGRENIFINGIVLGLSKREIRDRLNEIVQFAELEAVIDDPVKTYSLGMYMRLGFSVAIHADPEILLLDEILAVGDEGFQQKCLDRIADFRRRGRTVVLVSHDLGAIDRWSDEVIWLDQGVIRDHGLPRRVIDQYRQAVADHEAQAAATPLAASPDERAQRSTDERWGSREIEIVSVTLCDASGAERLVYRSGELARVVVRYRVHRAAKDPVFGIVISRADELTCYGTNTVIGGLSAPLLGTEGTVEVTFESLNLTRGIYWLDIAVHAQDGYPYDYRRRFRSFSIWSEVEDVGVFRIPHRWEIKPDLPRAIPPEPASDQTRVDA